MRERASFIHQCAAFDFQRSDDFGQQQSQNDWIVRSQFRLTGSLAHTMSLPAWFLTSHTPHPPFWVYAYGLCRCREQ